MTLLDVPFSDLNFNTQDHKFSVHEIQDGDKEQSIIKPFFPKIRPSFDFNSLFAGRSGSESTWNCLHCFCFCWASQRENPHNNECYQSDCLSIDVEFSHQIKANEPRKNILKIGIQSKWRTSSEYSLCMVFVLFFFFISERKKISLDRHSFETLKTTTYRNWTYFIPAHTIERPEKKPKRWWKTDSFASHLRTNNSKCYSIFVGYHPYRVTSPFLEDAHQLQGMLGCCLSNFAIAEENWYFTPMHRISECSWTYLGIFIARKSEFPLFHSGVSQFNHL